MLQKSIILFFISLPLLLSAQNKDTANVTWRPINLVVNNSFELSADAAKPLTKVEPVPKALGWSIPNKSQPLIYSTNEKGFIHDPNGTDWKFKARSGKNVVGLNIIGIKRDYVQGTLENPLEVGKKYYFAFWVHYHCSGANNIGIAFLPEKINVYVTTRLPLKPATYQKKVVPYSNSPQSSWVLVRDSFTAYQPFQNFVIGNFFEDEQTEVERTKFDHYFAYIDDVAVWEAREQPKISTETQTEKDNWQHNSDLVAKVKKNPQPNRTEPQPPIKTSAPKPVP